MQILVEAAAVALQQISEIQEKRDDEFQEYADIEGLLGLDNELDLSHPIFDAFFFLQWGGRNSQNYHF